MARILISTEAWYPQVSGVVRTLDTTAKTLRQWNHVVEILEPSRFPHWPTPFYPEIPMTFPWPHKVAQVVKHFQPDHIHIATEGSLGHVLRRYCKANNLAFTTSYHTKFPEYLQKLTHIPQGWSYRVLRWFHNGAKATMVATPSLEAELIARGFKGPLKRWSRGVDLQLFTPGRRSFPELPRPVMLYVGRVSKEKGLEDFLNLKRQGTKVIVGDGPARADYQAHYPNAQFWGYRRGEALAEAYRCADVFVFPSKTDTFGLVNIEALACGIPVAAYPVTGPIDIITQDELGALDDNLENAVGLALTRGNPAACTAYARSYTWENCTRQFLNNLVPVRS